MTGMDGPSDTHFGSSTVRLEEKQGLVDDVFRQVARRYDLMNDLMSLGVHRAWKNEFVTMLNPRSPCAVIDVAGGTGDIALRIAAAGGPRTHVTVCDINAEMLAVGRERAGPHMQGHLAFAQGNAEALPFAARSFDAYTIAFGIRNVPAIDKALAEAFRVLKLGGRFLCLEFSAVDMPGLDTLYKAYSSVVIPALGRIVAGDAAPYRYLVESIERFPRPVLFARMIEEAGFRRVTHRPLSGNIAAIHSAWKL
ncbi:demethylmenaquinone methyltransferase / 2-methoxy-6-polyprenyl-1,4-benzoquinol methylase [Rhizobiales bacterium GAS191]|jgi:demethylmenaquinone methyltransferase/2-methoxy-6-polyprenyl-1,4-benzoquinol methylase|nr:demethylmenaquinone methyltransferase / 2-methoxy-6-polyprenyl-1,4-benzoquinol methylase [Rhizobiales bacterium GAS113]SEC42669.1 demethylmenaquinone methyltransferase / 2-methoxy-6-polyprenyl-1,4-benzoquinol methylase [Rhizobiales bacterium GAS191]SEC83385.1 demethylmenaquinone methyltransferase / 2-methoxy-6-polyprenyl-1,4-benzoquinol methylase [Rhizobiales bacterium GAS188]